MDWVLNNEINELVELVWDYIDCFEVVICEGMVKWFSDYFFVEDLFVCDEVFVELMWIWIEFDWDEGKLFVFLDVLDLVVLFCFDCEMLELVVFEDFC